VKEGAFFATQWTKTLISKQWAIAARAAARMGCGITRRFQVEQSAIINTRRVSRMCRFPDIPQMHKRPIAAQALKQAALLAIRKMAHKFIGMKHKESQRNWTKEQFKQGC